MKCSDYFYFISDVCGDDDQQVIGSLDECCVGDRF